MSELEKPSSRVAELGAHTAELRGEGAERLTFAQVRNDLRQEIRDCTEETLRLMRELHAEVVHQLELAGERLRRQRTDSRRRRARSG